ncbi:hypothetical protein ABIA31_002562 [Catenulispora sp. MAP5-51]|jgi:hypothetical protein|uniref:hypothetical protein n=1 Tax=Catenulispora sp. MAP5-51 TaxID=3156298 RepID=UPI00351958E5
MRARRIFATGIAVTAAAGFVAFAPSSATADTAAPPSCEQAGQTTQKNISYYNCEYYVPGNPYLTWSGAPITRGQGTGELWGTCVDGSLPYYITVSWTDSAGTHSGTTKLTCEGGGKV